MLVWGSGLPEIQEPLGSTGWGRGLTMAKGRWGAYTPGCGLVSRLMRTATVCLIVKCDLQGYSGMR